MTTDMSQNTLQEISDAGVSIWLDDLSRDRLHDGSLETLISDSHVVGVTTNPSIFSAAIAKSTLYQADILDMASKGYSTIEIVTQLTTDDVRNACDLFAPTFVSSNGVDGRVSIEVDPELAYDTSATVSRGKYLWSVVKRPNLLIKVPATMEGLPAIEELTAQGISVNVTLIFSVERYRMVMDSYLRGLERRVINQLPINQIHSVASFFISRIDSLVDERLDASSPTSALRGKAAIANAHLAYEAFLHLTSSARWNKLASAGANFQRPLWASTGVKDKSYVSTKYVVELVADNCVNTMPENTLNELRANGIVRGDTITANFDQAREVLKDLALAGIDFEYVVRHLESDGVGKFEKAWKELLNNVSTVAHPNEVTQ
ncbi:MAG: transaldolase [Actinomycetes bacterium]